MASAAAQGDDDFDFADDTAADEQADLDWDDLDEPEQLPAAKPAPQPVAATRTSVPTPAVASASAPAPAPLTAPQPTPIVTKSGPIPFRDPSPPAASSPVAPSIVPPPGPSLPAAAKPAAANPAAAKPAAAKPAAATNSPATPAAPAPAAAGGASPVRASTPPARRYAAPPGPPPASGPRPNPSPQLHPSAAAAGGAPQAPSPTVSGPPAPTCAVAGSPVVSTTAGPHVSAASTVAKPPAAGNPAAAAAGVPKPAVPPPRAAAVPPPARPGGAASAASVQLAPAAASPAAQPAPAQAPRQPLEAPPPATSSAVATAASPAPVDEDSSSSSGGAGGGGGWGSWGLGGLSNKLQQVARGAAKDLQELTASVQQAVAEVVAADDVSEVERLSAYQERPSRPGPAPPAAAAAPPAAVTVSRADSLPHLPGTAAAAASSSSSEAAAGTGGPSPPVEATSAAAAAAELDPEEQKRHEVLARLQGGDTQLESGLKAIDDQVDMIAARAAKALGSLWGGFSSVAKQTVTVGAAITAQVEAAAKEVAKELAVGLEEGAEAGATSGASGSSGISLREAARHLAARAERTLESVGHGAAMLLDPQFGRAGQSGSQQQLGSSPSDWAATFDSCFELYGGAQAAEELEHLSSECAHICNRARAKLQREAKQQIDVTLTKLAPAFDLRSSSSEQQQQQQQAASSSIAEDEHLREAVEQLYLPVRSICSKGKHRASQLQQQAVDAAPKAATADATADSGTAADTSCTDEIQPEDAASKLQQQDTAGDDGSSVSGNGSSQLDQLLQQLLSGLRSVAVKSLAEVSAGQLMLLLALGRSLAALPRYGKPLDDGLEWPADPEAVAQLMQQQAQAMLADMQQLANIFKATAPALLQALQDAAAVHGQQALSRFSSELAVQLAKAAEAEVDADCGAALLYVRDGFGKLLYVVLLASLHRAGLQEHQEQPAKLAGTSSGVPADPAAAVVEQSA